MGTDSDDRPNSGSDGLSTAASMSRRLLFGRLGGMAGLTVGVLLLAMAAVSGAAPSDRLWAVAFGAFAFAIGAVLAFLSERVPVFVMDVLTVASAGALVFMADVSTTVRPALPYIYVISGTAIFAVRSWRTAVGLTGAYALSFAGSLAIGPRPFAPATRWFLVMSAVVVSGFFLRWLVSTLTAKVAAERVASQEATQARAALVETSRAKTEFLARMSHELRTPLNAVLGFADLLAGRMTGALTDRQQEYVDDIADSARHLLALVNDVFDPEKLAEGDLDLEIAPVDVPSLLADAIRLVRERAQAHGINLQSDVPPGVGVVDADQRRIRQAVVNLLGNAVKFTPAGGSVVVSAERRPTGVVIEVRDTGIGIAEDDLERIFDKFRTGRPMEGTGLGLPLTRRFVEAHGGRIWARSAPGRGSAFRFELPLHQPRSPRPHPATRPDELDMHEAFTRPGSEANRWLLARVGTVYSYVGAVLAGVFALITPVATHVRVAVAVLAFGAVCAGLAQHRWRERLPARGVSWWFGAAGIAAISVLTAFAGPFADLTTLTYGWITLTTVALLDRWRTLGHFLVVAVAVPLVLWLRPPPHPVQQGIATMMMLAGNAAIAGWIIRRLRRVVAVEQQTRQQAEQVIAELDRTSRHKSEFLANMSHELRTPLNAVIGFSELLVSGSLGPLNPTQRDYLVDIATSARHLLGLISDILDLAKIEAGHLQLDVTDFALQPVLAQVADDAQPLALSRGVHLEVAQPDDDLHLNGDAERVAQAVAKLVTNAVSFTPRGGRVVVATRRTGDDVSILVQDTGVGIVPEQRVAIFEAFSQVRHPEAGPTQGAGLGLPLANGLVELHGGRIIVESQPNVGSRFTVVLPQSRLPADRQPLAPSSTSWARRDRASGSYLSS